MMRALVLALVLLAGGAAAGEPPGDSLYQLPASLTTQDGGAATLALHAGHPVLVTMFYGSCPHVCPMLISSMQQMERRLPEGSRARLRVLMVSLDPERDTPQALREIAQRHRADLSRWTFARTDAPTVRKLAAALGIQYRRLPDGEFNHATVITLLDRQGRPLAKTSSMLRVDEPFEQALAAATAGR